MTLCRTIVIGSGHSDMENERWNGGWTGTHYNKRRMATGRINGFYLEDKGVQAWKEATKTPKLFPNRIQVHVWCARTVSARKHRGSSNYLQFGTPKIYCYHLRGGTKTVDKRWMAEMGKKRVEG